MQILRVPVSVLSVWLLMQVPALTQQTEQDSGPLKTFHPGDLSVEFVVGGLMESEGGLWKQEDSPLRHPFGIDFDSEGQLYVVELNGGHVHQVSHSGRVKVIAGDGSQSYRGDQGPASKATFNGMHNCVISSTNELYISDSWNHCVRRINFKKDLVETVIGNGQPGFSGDGQLATKAEFDFIMCVSLSADGTTLHLTDLKNRRIRDVDLQTGVVITVAGNGEKGVPDDGAKAIDSPLVDPRAAASDSNHRLYILERGGHALRVVGPEGRIKTVAGTGVRGYRDGDAKTAQFGAPKHLCFDERQRVYIADDLNGAIRRYDPETEMVTTILGRGFGDPKIRLLHPHGVRVHRGILYVVDSGNDRILRMKIDR